MLEKEYYPDSERGQYGVSDAFSGDRMALRRVGRPRRGGESNNKVERSDEAELNELDGFEDNGDGIQIWVK